ncbi:MAG: 5'/3'-nucleotidase SurE [Rhodospirillaceae bacterium]|nr:5'/3'-nucleotidase SurE [Rhodospirillaceae bacterium]
MTSWPIDLRKACVLLSNDDGLDAPGLSILREIAEKLCDDVWVVAPEAEQSGAGHSLTLQRPLRIRSHGGKIFSVDGTPTDCVLLAFNEIMLDRKPNLVLSGVNRGANLAEDITYSGTVAAAIEATLMGVPAIAFSQDTSFEAETDWTVARNYLADVVRRLVLRGWTDNTFINVNFPSLSERGVLGIKATTQGRQKSGDSVSRSIDPRGSPYYWIGGKRIDNAAEVGTDVAAVISGMISVTPIDLDFTHHASLPDLVRALR